MNPGIDIDTQVDKVVVEKKLRCEKPRHHPAGGGVNVARALTKLGGDTEAYFPLGGYIGEMLSALLEKEGVVQKPIKIKGFSRSNVNVVEKSSDSQYRFVMPGPELSKDEWEECIRSVTENSDNAKYLIASGSLPQGVPNDFYARLIEEAKSKNIKVIIDTAGEELKNAIEAEPFIVKPNIREMKSILDTNFENETDLIDKTLDFLKSKKINSIIISLGAGGALLINPFDSYHVRSPTVSINSKIGAGDSMVAGMVLKLSEGWSLLEAVKYGVASGASAVRTPGTELCELEAVEKLYDIIERDKNLVHSTT